MLQTEPSFTIGSPVVQAIVGRGGLVFSPPWFWLVFGYQTKQGQSRMTQTNSDFPETINLREDSWEDEGGDQLLREALFLMTAQSGARTVLQIDE